MKPGKKLINLLVDTAIHKEIDATLISLPYSISRAAFIRWLLSEQLRLLRNSESKSQIMVKENG